MLKSVSNDSDTSNFFSLTTVLVPGQDTFFFPHCDYVSIKAETQEVLKLH